jgi:hypothetical protein
MVQRYHRDNHRTLEEEQTIQWLKDTTEVIRSREEEQIIQWFKDTTEVIRSHEEEQIIEWLKDTTEVIRSREEEQTIEWLKYTTEVIRSREEEQIIQWLNDIVSGYKQTEDNSASEFTPVLSEVRVARSLVFCEVFCGSLLLLFLLAIVLSVLPLTASDYLCGIF